MVLPGVAASIAACRSSPAATRMAVSCRDASGDNRSAVAISIINSRTAAFGRRADECGPYAAGPRDAEESMRKGRINQQS
jgi:hypothetical protein